MLLFQKEKIKKKSREEKMGIGFYASFLLPAMSSCLLSLSVTEWSQMSYWRCCAKTSHAIQSLELSSLSTLGISPGGQDGAVPLPTGVLHTAQPHS